MSQAGRLAEWHRPYKAEKCASDSHPAYWIPPSLDVNTYKMCLRRRKLLPYKVLWKRTVRYANYLAVYCVGHPHATKQGLVLLHRIVMEYSLGRVLVPEEIVHHHNKDHYDNRVGNLRLISSSEHARLHHKPVTILHRSLPRKPRTSVRGGIGSQNLTSRNHVID